MAPDTSSSFELGPDLICPYNNLGGSDGKESARSVGDLGSVPGLGRFPGEGMATHSSILAWRIPWTGKPGGRQSMGTQSQT